VCTRLRRRDEARADAYASRSGGERRGNRTRGCDAPRGQHRHRDGIDQVGKQRQHAELTAHVPTRPGTLPDDEVAPCVDRRETFGQRADLPARQRAAGMHQLDERRIGLAVEEFHHARRARGDRHAVAVEKRHEEIDPERARRAPAEIGELCRQCLGRQHRCADHAEATGVRDRGRQRRRRDAGHRGELHGNRAADEVRETRAHDSKFILCAAGAGQRLQSPLFRRS
jgi:hypothetical protein